MASVSGSNLRWTRAIHTETDFFTRAIGTSKRAKWRKYAALVIRLLDAAEHLANHIHEAPVWIVPCLEGGTPTRTSGSSIYPAVQNILLAARALGLGATLTTLYLQFEKEAEAALGLPPDVHSYALLPIDYPLGRFGPVRRVPLSDVVFGDQWGQPYRDR